MFAAFARPDGRTNGMDGCILGVVFNMNGVQKKKKPEARMFHTQPNSFSIHILVIPTYIHLGHFGSVILKAKRKVKVARIRWNSYFF